MAIILIGLAIIGIFSFLWGCVEFMRFTPYFESKIKQTKAQKETKE